MFIFDTFLAVARLADDHDWSFFEVLNDRVRPRRTLGWIAATWERNPVGCFSERFSPVILPDGLEHSQPSFSRGHSEMGQGKATDVQVKEVSVSFEPVQFRAPLKFGGRVVSSSYLINAEVTVESHSGKHATGHGSMPVGNVWAWPSATLEPHQTEQLMMAYSKSVVDLFDTYPGFGHPLEIEFEVSTEYEHQARRLCESKGIT
jgi:hypothetical protein